MLVENKAIIAFNYDEVEVDTDHVSPSTELSRYVDLVTYVKKESNARSQQVVIYIETEFTKPIEKLNLRVE